MTLRRSRPPPAPSPGREMRLVRETAPSPSAKGKSHVTSDIRGKEGHRRHARRRRQPQRDQPRTEAPPLDRGPRDPPQRHGAGHRRQGPSGQPLRPPGGLPPQPRLRRRGVHPRKMLPLREMQRRPPRLPRAEVRPSGGAALRVQRLPRPRRMRAADSTCAGSCRRAGAWTTSPRRK